MGSRDQDIASTPSRSNGDRFPEDDLLPISALQHIVFCPRQCALIHLEQSWAENVLTAEGDLLHQRTDEPSTESRGPLRIARALKLRSLRLGLSGKADTVEFHRIDEDTSPSGCITLPGQPGYWRVFPVEYKRGRVKRDQCDEVQLCAQALCLEEMLGAEISVGALFYGEVRRRHDVSFDTRLRADTGQWVLRLRDLLERRVTPAAEYSKKCDRCSLFELCLPKGAGGRRRSAVAYLQRELRRQLEDPS